VNAGALSPGASRVDSVKVTPILFIEASALG
jgi:hypothetical protein